MQDRQWVRTKSVHVAVHSGPVLRPTHQLVYELRSNHLVHVSEYPMGIYVEEIV